MDIILIGKASHNRNDSPVVVYCGQDRAEAEKAVLETAGKFPRIYELNPEPFRPIRSIYAVPALPAAAQVMIPAAPAPAPPAAAVPATEIGNSTQRRKGAKALENNL